VNWTKLVFAGSTYTWQSFIAIIIKRWWWWWWWWWLYWWYSSCWRRYSRTAVATVAALNRRWRAKLRPCARHARDRHETTLQANRSRRTVDRRDTIGRTPADVSTNFWLITSNQWFLFLYLVGAAYAQWKMGRESFDKVAD